MAKKTVKIFNLEGKPVGKIKLPSVFETPLRPDIIKRAVLAIQSSRFQPKGRDPMAGKRTSAESRGVGLGIARIPRTKGPAGRAAFAPGTVSGRVAHPPTSEKKIIKQIPRKEKRLALMSAIAATASKTMVASRGHSIEDVPGVPLIVTDDLAELKKTKEVEEALTRLGVLSDIYRVRESRKVRAGRGKSRGRRIKQAVGPLIVITENKGIVDAASNIPGLDVVSVRDLNAEILAPGTHPGRLTIWTNSAIEELNKFYGGGIEA
ncbi:MAG: 50S ribosomal protein L4 [Candidatus Bathyarchaeota archaeon]|jgi:large subunit ribosomal protein L4e|nr:50S ribosomal protein L4 [Candidatus Bathyarchaeota archaeon A05DMB-5]MDH7557221.1 50S ribosomal protein L4 [Candidatus Bathyarchaeota archaeon]